MKPWELRQYSFKEFILAIRGNALREARQWDRARNIMFAVIKSQSGKKGPKKVRDVMEIPLIDKPELGSRSELKRALDKKQRMVERHYALKDELNKKLTVSNGESGTSGID